jgi:hypothetical protein
MDLRLLPYFSPLFNDLLTETGFGSGGIPVSAKLGLITLVDMAAVDVSSRLIAPISASCSVGDVRIYVGGQATPLGEIVSCVAGETM